MFEDPTVDSYVEIDDDEDEEDDEDEQDFDDDGERVAAEALIRRTLDKWNDPDTSITTTAEPTARTSVVYNIKTKPFTGKEAYNLLTNVNPAAVSPIKPYRPRGGNVYIYNPADHRMTKTNEIRAWRADGYMWDMMYGGAKYFPSRVEKAKALMKKYLWPLHKADKRFVRYEWALTEKSLKALDMKTSYVLVHYVGDETVFKPSVRRRQRTNRSPTATVAKPKKETNTNLTKRRSSPRKAKASCPLTDPAKTALDNWPSIDPASDDRNNWPRPDPASVTHDSWTSQGILNDACNSWPDPTNDVHDISSSTDPVSAAKEKCPRAIAPKSQLKSTPSQKRKLPLTATEATPGGMPEHNYFVQSKATKHEGPKPTKESDRMDPNAIVDIDHVEPFKTVDSIQVELNKSKDNDQVESKFRMKLLAEESELRKQLIKKKIEAADAKKKYYEMLTNQTFVHQF